MILVAACAMAFFEGYIPDGVSAGLGDVNPAIGFGPVSMFGDFGIMAGGGYRRSFNFKDFDEMGAWASWADAKYGRAALNFYSSAAENPVSYTHLTLPTN